MVLLDLTRCQSNNFSVILSLFLIVYENEWFLFFSVLDKIIVQGYKALQLQYFFTAGPDEVKAWTIQVILKNHF